MAVFEAAEAVKLWGGQKQCAHVHNQCGSGGKVDAVLVVPNCLMRTMVSHMKVMKFWINGSGDAYHCVHTLTAGK